MCQKIADYVSFRMRPCGALTLLPLPSSVGTNMRRAHAPECVELTFSDGHCSHGGLFAWIGTNAHRGCDAVEQKMHSDERGCHRKNAPQDERVFERKL